MRIIEKNTLNDTQGMRLTRMRFEAPAIARKALPGQFILLMVHEKGERIPLTIVETDAAAGTLTLIFQEVGHTTKLLGKKNVGDSLYSLVGPLGHPSEIPRNERVILVGGGVGIAEILPVARAVKAAGNHVVSVLGARTKDLLLLTREVGETSDRLLICTDDGSAGEKGLVTDVLKKLLAEPEPTHRIFCVGPVPMMRAVSETTRPSGIKTIVCLNTIMMDGTGMCGGCRLIEGGKARFCCVDGPDFDGHAVDFADLVQRQRRFREEEMKSLDHACRLEGTAAP
ncbi:MAG TPA: sulfide/dihydroorotate dehydrogenase-like FAD/NAD-binding protein [Elusimicrobiota bacterium]|nr:sulfide/dihydroorotate dehydrogenase-like FAD/NAD-binding protein [Elusimicrobiota bacterium]